ncbi:hypothetical protein EGW08_021420 [Elysia chlorotica]|uniref:Regulating synaptic membrane exocytosis protein 2 n=1 Tax=Elysia chlorotica TaxID=188477 RepID=A0A433SNM1_ELYCH|nr:hypothetical protein EGW08_021420 [Elysia chlorotica]
MSFLLKKVIKPWNSSKASQEELKVPDMPELPPSPDLSHLTPDEIHVINDVIKRQEEFDRQEANRVQRLKEELENMEEELSFKHRERPDRKVVDLRLCRLCFKTKFADGVGRLCHDCQQRVCQQCGDFSKPRRSNKSGKSLRRRWCCKLCLAKREVLCRTGGWYHGLEPDTAADVGPVGGVRKKLSLVSMDVDDDDFRRDDDRFDYDGADRSDFDRDFVLDTDIGSSTCYGNDTNNEGENDSERCPSGSRTDNELTRRRYLPHANSLPIYDGHRESLSRTLPHINNNGHDVASNRNIYDQHSKQSHPQQQHYHSTPRSSYHQHQQRYETKSDRRHSIERGNDPKLSSVSGACAKSGPEGRRQPRRRSLPVDTNSKPDTKKCGPIESASFLVAIKGSRSLDTDNHGNTMNGIDKEGAARNRYLDDDDDSLESLILERKMSMRRRKEKRQRRKLLRSGQDQRSAESLIDINRLSSSRDRCKSPARQFGTDLVVRGEGQRRDSVTRSLLCHSNSLTSCAWKASPISEGRLGIADTTSTSTTFSSFRDSSMSDRGTASPSLPRSPATFRTIRQDAFSLNSSCLSLGSTNEVRGRDSGRGLLRSPVNTNSRSGDSLHGHSLQVKPQGRASPKMLGETSLQKWVRAGFQDTYLVTLPHHPKEPQFGLHISGGVQDNLYVCRALVATAASDLRAKVHEGDEVLEWNGEALRGQSFDHVVSVTLQPCAQAVLLLHPFTRKAPRSIRDEPTVLVQSVDQSLSASPDLQAKTAKRRMLPRTPVQMKRQTHRTQGELELGLLYQASRATLAVTVLQARDLGSPLHGDGAEPSPMVVLSLGPEGRHMKRETLETETRQSTASPDWEQTFLLDGVTITEVVTGALQVTVWSQEDKQEVFLGEVLIDLIQAQLDNQAQWYRLEEHDENSMALPKRRGSHCTSRSASLTSSSIRDGLVGNYYSPNISPEVPSHRRPGRSPSLIGSTNVSPVPSCIGSRDSALNNASQPDTFTTKVRKKMLNTVSKMSSLSLLEKKENGGSDESSHELHQNTKRRLSDRGDWSGTMFIPSPGRSRHSSHNSMDLLALPKPPTRNNSSCSFLTSDDDEAFRRFSTGSACSDRPPPEGDDVTSNLGPGQIPPKTSAETTICGDIKLGFMVSKGQLEVDIVCAMGLHKSGSSQPPDTYVKTYLVEGRKVIQRKKTLVVKASYDPIYNKKLKYSACNVHGRIMKVDVWERVGSFEKKCCRGEVLVRLDGLDLCRHTVAWYKLFQINSTDYGSDELLNVW